MSGKTNKNITYGTVDVLADDEFIPSNVKIRVTTFIDLDIVQELKNRAQTSKTKYQTLLNNILRTAVIGNPTKPITEARVRQIAKEVAKELIKDELRK